MDTQALALRVPPHSIEAEASVLGGLLLDNSAWEKIGDMVRPNDFYRADHRVIFESIAKLIDGGRPADVVTVYEALQSIGRADEVGFLDRHERHARGHGVGDHQHHGIGG